MELLQGLQGDRLRGSCYGARRHHAGASGAGREDETGGCHAVDPQALWRCAWVFQRKLEQALGAERALDDALARAGLDAGDVDYLNLHGTASARNDEVEAALDDANVTRFVELLRRYSDRAQFIVITHNPRTTSEAADAVYGVTMQEQGVSRVVAVDVDEALRMREEAAA